MVPLTHIVLAAAVACSPKAMTEQMKAEAHTAHGKLGVSARVIETPQAFAYHGGHGFPMQSVYKLPIAIAVLHRVEAGKLDLQKVVPIAPEDMIPPTGHSPIRDKNPKGTELTIAELLRRAIVDSDGTASDVLMRQIGGVKAVRHYLKEAELKHVNVKHTEAELVEDKHLQYEDSAEPDAMVTLLTKFEQGKLLNEQDTAMLMGWMREAPTGNDRMRAKLPAGTAVADKTGSSGTGDDGVTPATNDVGLVTLPNGNHLAIAIFLQDAKAKSAVRNDAIADAAKIVWECWETGEQQ